MLKIIKNYKKTKFFIFIFILDFFVLLREVKVLLNFQILIFFIFKINIHIKNN